MIRLLIAHEHPIIGQSLAVALHGTAELEVVQHAITAEQAMAYLENQSCDVIVVSATLRNDGVIKLADFVANSRSPAKVLVIGVIDSPKTILYCLEAGASGYVCEDESLDSLIEKVHALQRGEFPLPPAIATSLVARLRDLKSFLTTQRPRRQDESNPLLLLTARELEIFWLLVADYDNKSIAKLLTIEDGTAKIHVHRIMKKLNITKREQARLFATQKVK